MSGGSPDDYLKVPHPAKTFIDMLPVPRHITKWSLCFLQLYHFHTSVIEDEHNNKFIEFTNKFVFEMHRFEEHGENMSKCL